MSLLIVISLGGVIVVYGYKRVSTKKSGTNGNSLEDQENKLKEAGAEIIISDIYTGTKMNRPNLDRLMKKLAEGDTLIVTKLDRLARTAIEGSIVIRELYDRGVVVHILNMGRADRTPMGKLIVIMVLAFAEFERDMIVERTQIGKELARAKGIRVDGRPKKFSTIQIDHALGLLDEGNSYTHVEKLTGISKSTLIRAKRNRQVHAITN